MSFLRIITGLWENQEETYEQAWDPMLATRYFEMDQSELVPIVLWTLEHYLPKWKIIHLDLERGEIMVETIEWFHQYDVVISVYPLFTGKSTVDIVSAKRSCMGDLGACYRHVSHFFGALQAALSSREEEYEAHFTKKITANIEPV
ncbi:hypothetical protein [Brevibacillus laterosporus]|uniref:hypothetical protein n=1 Tax=Brevibacillus laterosporus TaxID=1465 RepID=UPI000CE4F9FF|nr:hypothetical protein [Brevibacillus laterosporus]MED1662291.1 hypothetical protein [Brevibacillus laterosporus]MED1670795.1 hypothetical protein [Brevibacillus laterosporus]MED1720786.1 hypothetical protein [Brevibacillus laterosporus]PPA81010.1 hypothetical protein C4A76_24540 [Brevibacillus laterosporus]